jgi:GxxExxY protein
MIHEDVSGKIIGAAMEVLNELNPGLDEKLYERALSLELKNRGHVVSVQRSFPVWYRGELIGNLVPDLIVDNAIIVDPKVVACFTETHVAQMIGYLNITGLDLALLINFKNARLEWKRVLRRQENEGDTQPDLHASFSYPCYPCNPWLMP